MEAILTIGISASGKSTWTKGFLKSNPEYIEINRDKIRAGLQNPNTVSEAPDWKTWDWSLESEVNSIVNSHIFFGSFHGISLVISDTNLHKKHREALKEHLESLGYSVSYKIFDVDLEVCIERDSKRENPVGPDVIMKQHNKFQSFLEEYNGTI